MLTASQLRSARGLLDWTQGQLAEAAGISLPTVKRMEGDKGPGKSSAENVEAIRRALESAGVAFIPAGDYQGSGGPGVRLVGGDQ
jgi:transcriptional regulator with XRE-family HTH domain